MHLELRDSIPALSYVGYVGAVATATIRLLKNKHWLGDVVAGAVVGILSAKLAHFIVSKGADRRARTNIHNAEPEVSEELTIAETSERR
jgi:membrane-associated phospholipid phosphatase